ncbi:hypothetical protein SCT_1145 [Sulfuricella sp. T08]|uniref:hypothetical protein n=1 Tax=Sulfuricella sp. T08 TaxID=1632857 RepID=UPI0006179635|nr:hypothetical protein [Sulfuricella sp. T08]GAO35754.1 hypothetical protein SCT_1145 [Sulfuricella sp. T08]
MEYVISKIDAAVDQLDWSIRLFLDHQAYVPAITLAGAAEGIIGEPLSDQSAFALLKKKLSSQFGLLENVVNQSHLNKARNWLKHWKGLSDKETVSLELETEAIQYIVRAVASLVAHDRSLPSEAPRFFEWLSSNRTDLYQITCFKPSAEPI